MKKYILFLLLTLPALVLLKIGETVESPALPVSSSVDAAGANPYCLGASGTFIASNWPAGQTIDIACAGDTGTAGCRGEIATLSPGQSYDFNNCTCAPYGTEGDGGTTGLTGGCLFVGRDLRLAPQNNGNVLVLGDTSLPPGCTLQGGNPIACGSNGQVISRNISIVCNAPTPTPTTPVPTATRTPTPSLTTTPTLTPTGTLTPTLTPTVTPSSCPVPEEVLNVRIECPFCDI